MDSRLVTILGIITAVVFAVAPDLAQINPSVSRYAMLIGVACAAVGRELISTRQKVS